MTLELYKVSVGLDEGSVPTLPNATKPGSPGEDNVYKTTTPPSPADGTDGNNVGGSDVGLNPGQDQYIRDMIDQTLPDILPEMLPELLANIPNPAGEVITMYQSVDFFVANAGGADPMSGTYVGTIEQCSQPFPGGPLIGHFSANVNLQLLDPAAALGSGVRWSLAAQVFVDDNLLVSIPVSQGYNDTLPYEEFTMCADWILNAGVIIGNFERPDITTSMVSIAQQAALFTPGKHLIRIDWAWNAAMSGTVTSATIQVKDQFLQFRRAANLGCFF